MKPMTEMDPNRLQDHVLSTYITLRAGIAIIALTLPLVIFLAGKFSGVELQGSISAYYWADEIEPNIPRTLFIGGIFAVASGLYLYKGFTAAENIALNLAAVLATLVAAARVAVGEVESPKGKIAIHSAPGRRPAVSSSTDPHFT